MQQLRLILIVSLSLPLISTRMPAQSAQLQSSPVPPAAQLDSSSLPSPTAGDTVSVRLIADQSTIWTTAEIVTVLSLLVALVSLIVGPWVALRVAEKQIRASVVSANRQAWINALRDELATLDSQLVQVAAYAGRREHEAAYVSALTGEMRAVSRIKLFINPKESDHSQLVEEMRLVHSHTVHPVNIEQLNAGREKLLALGQAILKREWERVKAGN